MIVYLTQYTAALPIIGLSQSLNHPVIHTLCIAQTAIHSLCDQSNKGLLHKVWYHSLSKTIQSVDNILHIHAYNHTITYKGLDMMQTQCRHQTHTTKGFTDAQYVL